MVILSLPHLKNVHQWSVNNFWSCVFGSMSDAGSSTSINMDCWAYIGRWAGDIPATASRTVTTYFIYKATTKCWWAFWCTRIVKIMYMSNNGHIALWLTMMEGEQSLTLHWHSFSWCGQERISVCFDHYGSQYMQHRQQHTKVNILQFALAYLNATMNCETGNAEPEIGTDWYCQIRQNPLVDRYRSRFGPPRSTRSNCWMGVELN